VAKEKGFKLLFQSANGDPVSQIDQVNTMLSQGVDALIVNAVSADTEKTQMTTAAGRVPLLFIDTPIPDVGFTTVQSDNATIGKDAGALMAERIGAGKTVKVAILNGGPTDVEVGPARRKGFLAGLESKGVKYQIVAEATASYAQDKAVPATEDMLSAHPDIDVIFGYNDAMALGALSVLKSKANTKALVARCGRPEGSAQGHHRRRLHRPVRLHRPQLPVTRRRASRRHRYQGGHGPGCEGFVREGELHQGHRHQLRQREGVLRRQQRLLRLERAGHVADAAIIGKADTNGRRRHQRGSNASTVVIDAGIEILYPHKFAASSAAAHAGAGDRVLQEMSKRMTTPSISPNGILDEFGDRYRMVEAAEILEAGLPGAGNRAAGRSPTR